MEYYENNYNPCGVTLNGAGESVGLIEAKDSGSGNDLFAWLNGTQGAAGTTAVTLANFGGQKGIGARYDGTQDHLPFLFTELAIMGTGLTAAQREDLNAYCLATYGKALTP